MPWNNREGGLSVVYSEQQTEPPWATMAAPGITSARIVIISDKIK